MFPVLITQSQDTDITNALNALTTSNTASKVAVRNLIVELKEENLWDKIDRLLVHGDNSTDSLLDLKHPDEHATNDSAAYTTTGLRCNDRDNVLIAAPSSPVSGGTSGGHIFCYLRNSYSSNNSFSTVQELSLLNGYLSFYGLDNEIRFSSIGMNDITWNRSASAQTGFTLGSFIYNGSAHIRNDNSVKTGTGNTNNAGALGIRVNGNVSAPTLQFTYSAMGSGAGLTTTESGKYETAIQNYLTARGIYP